MKVKLEKTYPVLGDGVFLTIPPAILKVMGWGVGDDISVEVVVDRRGASSHIVLEKA